TGTAGHFKPWRGPSRLQARPALIASATSGWRAPKYLVPRTSPTSCPYCPFQCLTSEGRSTMAPGTRHRTLQLILAVLTMLIGGVVVSAANAQTPEIPRRGGVLLAAIAADAPSLDPHQEATFATMELVAPLYSLLIQIDPLNYPRIIGDLATEWNIAPDG